MKKNLFYYLFAMICSVALFASCSDDDDEVTGLTIDQVVGTFTGQLEVLNQSIPGTSIFVTKVDANTVKVELKDFKFSGLTIGDISAECKVALDREGDDFDLKISDKANPSYLVIANDPEKEQVIGSLNALVLNRLITRVNSKGNIPVSIIVDELPTLYFHKIDRLIGTARSNKVAVTLGFQELPQLEADYGKVGMQKIITTCGNIFMGAARNKETLEWAQNDVFGKAKQTSRSISINDHKVSTTISEKMDFLVPAAKIADMATGWLAGQAARDFTATDDSMLDHFDIEQSEEFKTTKYFCKTHFDMKKIKDEEKHYVSLPKIYEFKNDKEKEILLNRNFKRVNQEVEDMVKELLGIS